MYSEKVMKYFKSPKNMGKIKNADGVGKVGNIACGDILVLYIKVIKKNGKEIISNIKVETLGCAAAIATSSMVTELAKGKTLEEAMKISKDIIAKELGGLPPIKLHCSVLAVDALKEAVYDYCTKSSKPVSADLEKDHARIKKEYENVCQRHE